VKTRKYKVKTGMCRKYIITHEAHTFACCKHKLKSATDSLQTCNRQTSHLGMG